MNKMLGRFSGNFRWPKQGGPKRAAKTKAAKKTGRRDFMPRACPRTTRPSKAKGARRLRKPRYAFGLAAETPAAPATGSVAALNSRASFNPVSPEPTNPAATQKIAHANFPPFCFFAPNSFIIFSPVTQASLIAARPDSTQIGRSSPKLATILNPARASPLHPFALFHYGPTIFCYS